MTRIRLNTAIKLISPLGITKFYGNSVEFTPSKAKTLKTRNKKKPPDTSMAVKYAFPLTKKARYRYYFSLKSAFFAF
ncbi:MAG: hypothetical protein UW45_C0043G0002 [Parcubacteria group bacterium GW2011_GWC2_44_22]|nr:MAG: hypothetical protein UW45_C0043G0002 [Parcubacteria group bacterium GW2011_GWC2_44_22]